MSFNYSDIKFHRMLVADQARSQSYQAAINQVVQQGDVVLDIGTGSGLLALLAVKAGAAKVYAIEKTDIIELAKQLAAENSCADKIEFINEDAAKVELPEKVDVIVSELISKAVIGQRHEELIRRFHQQSLKLGGKIIPDRVTLRVAPVSCEEIYLQTKFPTDSSLGVKFDVANKYLQNHPIEGRVKSEYLLSKSQIAYDVDSYDIKANQYPNKQLKFSVEDKSILHGFVCWFESVLAADIHLDSGIPGLKSWDNLFFFLPHPVEVDESAQIYFTLLGKQIKDETFWSWKTLIKDPCGHDSDLEFTQNSFAAKVISPATLREKQIRN